MIYAQLKAPFPYFGGKSKVASLVWEKLGDVDNFIEPFSGSAAVLLNRPHTPKIETLNDADCYVANFWRATGKDPEAVAEHADNPVNEADLHSRHRWLVLSDDAREFRQKMRAEPDFYDAKVAGWWCWGACCWIGSGWCPTTQETGAPAWDQVPHLADWNRQNKINPTLSQQAPGQRKGALCGVHAVLEVSNTHRPQLGDAYARGRGVHGNDSAGTCEQRRAWLIDWFGRLRDRLRTVRVCCGDWIRVCDSHSVTTRLGITGIFFDPPYSAEADRCNSLYGVESKTVAHDVRAYCLERGSDPMMRLVLAGYAGEGHEALESAGWQVIEWKAAGGYGNRSVKGKDNAARERLWISPHCVKSYKPRSLFDAFEAAP